ncbi:GNAT family N-acetyltransferase [Baekduia sp.]|uniref:GNAT family N-acetyltransferase n=1 Tax=Baekduia sp. TaxID=2600305 RepID=UPI002E029655|nr:GNAT family N-acetyltransferase [Baekduia sp.]
MALRDDVHIERWSEEDLALLTALNSDAVQMRHIGGAESPEKIAERQQRYAKDPFQFRIVDGGAAAGWVGFWEREWRGEKIYEIGWAVLPAFQRRRLATTGTALALDAARAAAALPVHAFPGVDNAPSNAVCRKLGFSLVEADMAFEFPPGSMMVCNDWRWEG